MKPMMVPCGERIGKTARSRNVSVRAPRADRRASPAATIRVASYPAASRRRVSASQPEGAYPACYRACWRGLKPLPAR